MRINTIRLRATIGWLGMLLPWIVVLLVGYIPKSISATWYTNACTVFMIILGSASFLLISYKGYDKKDDVLLTCSGIAGLGICLFPCSVTEEHELVGTFMIDNQASDIVHMVCAVTFFGLLAYNSIFLFTKSAGEVTTKKKARNIIFRVCGAGMVASFLLLLLPIPCVVWVVETVALFFFGVSFLTKANIYPWLFCDETRVSSTSIGKGAHV
jgi:heme A synthase